MKQDSILENTGSQVYSLSDLSLGDQGIVLEIEDAELQMALNRIGLLKGDDFIITEQAPLGGPIALKIKGGKVALRASDARKVKVRKGQ